MRRADRLFQIIQVLRRARAPITAEAIAAELEISKRTLYRDIAALIGQRVPIRGEAGVGYVLEQGFHLPPLMLTPDEIEAAVLGAQLVRARADPALARAAEDFVAKLGAAVPERLRPYVLEPTGAAPVRCGALPDRPPDGLDMSQVRAWIHAGRKIHLHYCDEQGAETRRTVWPVAIGYHETVRMLAGWCELRRDFRHFRTDRVVLADFRDERYPERPAALKAKWRKTLGARPRRDV
jgi:predicted DNA-binding transcriptional regulator YafY